MQISFYTLIINKFFLSFFYLKTCIILPGDENSSPANKNGDDGSSSSETVKQIIPPFLDSSADNAVDADDSEVKNLLFLS